MARDVFCTGCISSPVAVFMVLSSAGLSSDNGVTCGFQIFTAPLKVSQMWIISPVFTKSGFTSKVFTESGLAWKQFTVKKQLVFIESGLISEVFTAVL